MALMQEEQMVRVLPILFSIKTFPGDIVVKTPYYSVTCDRRSDDQRANAVLP
jgi:hypothetical protein